ncbi:AMED_5909 family protein [Actinokineospora sp. NBRC 105648]|uniref:AMED_5909 family protein n=1 Tax=Actinokineospora sp. NBRC 105648 TaxID=3032206 RepID=UPI0024A2CE85|nr:AMED_5909 family protein [Actinokineospora sp. NBRC 105648]GLZ38524.1 hypothetical protein Acsp05_21480 [Actinokineospora sp. NBRC 105648]
MSAARVRVGTGPGEIRLLRAAHKALVAIRPAPSAPVSDWRKYYYHSAATYRKISQVDAGNVTEALYWAEREHEKAQRPLDKIPTDAIGTGPHKVRFRSLDALCRELDDTHPSMNAQPSVWLTYHEYCAELFAAVAEIDRWNHHLALYYADKSRQAAREIRSKEA